ncbi:MAG TPA: hypothetical protein VG106_14750 [Vicinamibacterales bacterium]|nr:hypothetical protein [Vicinamibacterales bacterium]
MNTKSPLSRKELVDEYFIENRTRLLEIAAFLDRVDRAGGAGDFRMQAFAEALSIAAAGGSDRLLQIQRLLSDPTTEPLPALDRKSALGAYDKWSRS